MLSLLERSGWLKANPEHEHFDGVSDLLKAFDDSDTDVAYHRNEDDWTRRLVLSLSMHPKIGKERIRQYTAEEATGLKSTQLGIASSMMLEIIRCYMFRGAPDIDMENHVIVQHGVENTEEGSKEFKEALLTTTKRVIGEVAKHLPLGFPFQKFGELLSNMHINFTDRILTKESIAVEKSTGIFLDKPIGATIFEMQLNEGQLSYENCTYSTFEICMHKMHCELLTEPLLCSVLHHCSLFVMH